MKAVFMTTPNQLNRVYDGGRKERVQELCDVYPDVVSSDDFDAVCDQLTDIDVIFSTWGMPQLTEEQIARMPNLKAVFYGAHCIGRHAP